MSSSEDGKRRPQSFSVGGDAPKIVAQVRKPAAFDDGVVLVQEADDPFLGEAELAPAPPPRRRGLPLFSIFFSAAGLIISVAVGLWLDGLVRDLFSRADWLGYTAIGVVAIAVLAVLGMAGRELIAMRRLAAVQSLKAEAEAARADRMPVHARRVLDKLVALSQAIPETAAGRAALARTSDEIIDSEGLLTLAELELLAPADRRARALVLAASKRVSIVTAVSPRALVDLGYVLFESTRLVRAVAETYGTRPGRLGLLKLLGDVVAHLAVTGSIAVGDSIVQQLLGHGLASKVSARLGEGVVNGLMTARIGIAAMDLLRPLPFKAVRRPGIGDFVGDLTGRG